MPSLRPYRTAQLARRGLILPARRAPSLTVKKWILLIVVGIASLLVSCTVCVGVIATLEEAEVEWEDTTPGYVAPSGSDLVEEFGCQWIMDTYRPMTILGRDNAILHLSNVMNLEAGPSFFSYVSTGDAARALNECESKGFR